MIQRILVNHRWLMKEPVRPSKPRRAFAHNEVETLNPLYSGEGKGFAAIKKFVYGKNILLSQDIARNEMLAEDVIRKLWVKLLPLTNLEDNAFREAHIFRLIPSHVQKRVESAHAVGGNAKLLLQDLADYISGMTDRFAIDFLDSISNHRALKSI